MIGLLPYFHFRWTAKCSLILCLSLDENVLRRRAIIIYVHNSRVRASFYLFMPAISPAMFAYCFVFRYIAGLPIKYLPCENQSNSPRPAQFSGFTILPRRRTVTTLPRNQTIGLIRRYASTCNRQACSHCRDFLFSPNMISSALGFCRA